MPERVGGEHRGQTERRAHREVDLAADERDEHRQRQERRDRLGPREQLKFATVGKLSDVSGYRLKNRAMTAVTATSAQASPRRSSPRPAAPRDADDLAVSVFSPVAASWLTTKHRPVGGVLEEPGIEIRALELGDHTPADEDDDAIGEGGELPEVRRRYHHRCTCSCRAPNELVELRAGRHVHALGGLVEQQHRGIAAQPAGEDRLLLVASRERLERRVHRRGADPEAPDRLEPLLALGPVPPAQPRQ